MVSCILYVGVHVNCNKVYCTSMESNHVLVQLVTRKVEGCCHLQSHIKIDCVIKVLSFVINVVINHCVAKVVSTTYCVKMT